MNRALERAKADGHEFFPQMPKLYDDERKSKDNSQTGLNTKAPQRRGKNELPLESVNKREGRKGFSGSRSGASLSGSDGRVGIVSKTDAWRQKQSRRDGDRKERVRKREVGGRGGSESGKGLQGSGGKAASNRVGFTEQRGGARREGARKAGSGDGGGGPDVSVKARGAGVWIDRSSSLDRSIIPARAFEYRPLPFTLPPSTYGQFPY